MLTGNYNAKGTDIYALGVMLYAMLHYNFPYSDEVEGDDHLRLIERAKRGTPRYASTVSAEARQLMDMLL